MIVTDTNLNSILCNYYYYYKYICIPFSIKNKNVQFVSNLYVEINLFLEDINFIDNHFLVKM